MAAPSYHSEKETLIPTTKERENTDIDREYLNLSLDTPSVRQATQMNQIFSPQHSHGQLEYEDVFPNSIDVDQLSFFVVLYSSIRNFGA